MKHLVFLFLGGCTYLSEADLEARMDLDGDGIPRPTDCDDDDEAVGAPELRWVDLDGDGWGSEAEVLDCEPESVASQTGDCDDEDPDVFPGAEELCNSIDDDCDDEIDEGLEIPTWYLDGDSDGYGLGDESVQACDPPESYVDNDLDCDDQDDSVNPDTPWYLDADGDGYGDPDDAEASCTELSGRVRNDLDCDDGSYSINPDATEICDADDVDEDCDGLADDADDSVDGVFDLFYADTDGDGLGDPAVTMDRCDESADWSANGRDCDDSDVAIGDCGWIAVSAGLYHSCGVRGSGAVACWGSDDIASMAPEGSYVDVDLDSGSTGGCALATDGTIDCFVESSYYDYSGVFTGPYMDVCAAYGHFCALDLHGRLECNGSVFYGSPPIGDVFVDVDCDYNIGCALAADGTATCWGRSHTNVTEIDVAASGWEAIAVSNSHACGLTTAGELECSGEDYGGNLTVTGGPYTSLGAGEGHTYTIDTDDALDHWGYAIAGVNLVPTGRFESVDGGRYHACAVTETGVLHCWGCQGGWDFGQCTVPEAEAR